MENGNAHPDLRAWTRPLEDAHGFQLLSIGMVSPRLFSPVLVQIFIDSQSENTWDGQLRPSSDWREEEHRDAVWSNAGTPIILVS